MSLSTKPLPRLLAAVLFLLLLIAAVALLQQKRSAETRPVFQEDVALRIQAVIPDSYVIVGSHHVLYITVRPDDTADELERLVRDESILPRWRGRLVIYSSAGIAEATLGGNHVIYGPFVLFGDAELLAATCKCLDSSR